MDAFVTCGQLPGRRFASRRRAPGLRGISLLALLGSALSSRAQAQPMVPYRIVQSFPNEPCAYVLQPGPEDGKDAWVNRLSTQQDTNFGSHPRLALRGPADVFDEKRAYMEFAIPPGAESVSLILYQFDMDRASTVSLHKVTSDWDEDTITWNNLPTAESSAFTTFTTVAGAAPGGEEYTVDLSAAAVPGETLKIEMRIDDRWGSFYSSDYTDDPSLRPKLAFTIDCPRTGEFGSSAAAAGDNVLVGAPGHDPAGSSEGAAFLFEAASGALLRALANPSPQNGGGGAPTVRAGDGFGFSAAASGTVVVVGAPFDEEDCVAPCPSDPDGDGGAAYLFDGETGELLERLTFPQTTLQAGDWFGYSAAFIPSGAGEVIAVGSPFLGRSLFPKGLVHLFDLSQDGRSAAFRRSFDPPPGDGGGFGQALATQKVGGNLFVGAPVADRVSLWTLEGSVVQRFPNPSAAGDVESDDFGSAIASVGENIVVVGSPGEDMFGTDAGAAYVFKVDTGDLLATLREPDPQANRAFGTTLAALGDRVVVGAPGEASGSEFRGAVYVFHAETGVLFASIPNPIPVVVKFGQSVAAFGDRIIVGAPADPTNVVLVFAEDEHDEADLALAVSDLVDPIEAGRTIVYEVHVTNSGPDGAGNVTLRFETPPELTLRSGASSVACSQEDEVTTCSLGPLPAGSSADASVAFEVAQGTQATVETFVTVTSNTFDPSPGDNVWIETTRVEDRPLVNPNGWIQTDGWNLLFPLVNAAGCSGGGEEHMGRNWLHPFDISEEDPKAGTVWEIDFSGQAMADGYDLGGLSSSPLWLSCHSMEGTFTLNPGEVPVGDVVDFGELVGFLNARVVPGVEGADTIPRTDVLGVATTYVENISGGPLDVEICTASSDSLRVWVNNTEVTRVSACRDVGRFCEESRRAILPAGVSKIAVQVWQGGGEWAFTLGIKEGETLFTQDSGDIRFLGTGGAQTSGQSGFRITRRSDVVADICGCPSGTCECLCPTPFDFFVTIQGEGPGNDGDVFTVSELVTARDPSAIGFPGIPPQQIADVVARQPYQVIGGLEQVPPGTFQFERHTVVGTDVGGESTTTFDGGINYESVSSTAGDIGDCADDFEFSFAVVDFEAMDAAALRLDVSIAIPVKLHETGEGRWGRFGLMARQSLDRDSRFTMVADHLPLPANGDDPARVIGRRQHRVGCGSMYELLADAPLEHPKYMRLKRDFVSTVIQCWLSDDPAVEADPCNDANWVLIHEDDWGDAMPKKLYVGFANSEHHSEGPARQSCTFRPLCTQGFVVEAADPSADPVVGKSITWTDITRRELRDGLVYQVTYDDDHVTRHSGEVRSEEDGSEAAALVGLQRLPFNPFQTGPLGIFENAHSIGATRVPEAARFEPLGAGGDGAGAQNEQTCNPPAADIAGTYYVTGPDTYSADGKLKELHEQEFYYTYKTIQGDFDFRARVTIDETTTDPGWFGLMARNQCTNYSKYSFILERIAPPQLGLMPSYSFRVYHETPGSRRDQFYVVDDPNTVYPNGRRQPVWMRLVRQGRAIYGYLSEVDDDGHPARWVLVGSDVAKDGDRPDCLRVGLGVRNGAVRAETFSLETPSRCGEWDCQTEVAVTLSPPVFVKSRGEYMPEIVDGRVRLTDETTAESSTQAWYCTDGQKLAEKGFRARFKAFMSSARLDQGDRNADPAHGMTFAVVQGSCSGDLSVADLGGDPGAAIGFEGGTLRERTEGHPSFAVEIDNWNGGGEPPNEVSKGGSPDEDGTYHFGLDLNASVSSLETNAQEGHPSSILPDIFSPDGITVEVHYDPGGNIAVLASSDGTNPIKVLRQNIPPLEGDVILGFTAASGSFTGSEVETPKSCTQEIGEFAVTAFRCTNRNVEITPLPFGDAKIGTQPTRPVATISNSSRPNEPPTPDCVLEVRGAELTAETSPEFTLPGQFPVSIAPGESLAIEVTYTPLDEGPDEGELRIDVEGAGAPLSVSLLAAGVAETPFIRGDVDANGAIEITDAVVLFNWLFLGGVDTPPCMDAADANDKDVDRINLTDGVFVLNWLFGGGRPPPPPGTETCGVDPTADAFSCLSYPPCE